MFKDPALAALIGWLVAMTSRQTGHFFFEPRDYDIVNQATHEYKEAVKVGYNISRKIVLMSVWALSPLLLLSNPTICGLIPPRPGLVRPACRVFVAGGGRQRPVVPHRAAVFHPGFMTGLAWITKILTDPFNDVKLYCRAPLQLLRGGLLAELRRTSGRAGAFHHVHRQPARACATPRPTLSPMRPHLAQDPPFDRFVGGRVSAHHQPSRRIASHAATKRSATASKSAVGVVQAEDQPAGAHPTERQALGAQVILQHPVVARRQRIADGPDRRQMFDT